MRTSGMVVETQHVAKTREKVILDCISFSTVYCVNHLSDKTNTDLGIIAGIGDKSKINYLLRINLDKPNNRAEIKIKKPYNSLPAPAFNEIRFLHEVEGNTVRSFDDLSYEFGVHLEHDLDTKYKEYIQNPENAMVIIKHRSDNHR